ncbi:hypothetical protein [Fusobacterium sp. PH5-44]|uniref:hypothetical protein n=1 Tax=unclassified Fusobacterium TaxID=2648384 RepID=UPI003D1E2A06
MRRYIYVFLLLTISAFTLANGSLGIVDDEDLLKVGVTQENIDKAKETIENVGTKYKLALLEKKQTELEVNKYMLSGTDEYVEEIEKLFDKMGEIEATILKDRYKSQREIRKYITQEQYIRARENALQRMGKFKIGN